MPTLRTTATSLALTLCIAAGATAKLAAPALAQGVGDGLETMVRDLAQGIRDNYVFPDKGEQAAEMLEQNLGAGRYDNLDEFQLAQTLTRDLRSITADRHFSVRPAPPPGQGGTGGPAAMPRQQPSGTFGFEKIERLDGNIGYVDLRGFAPRELAEPTVHAAMRLMQGSDALIFDLRKNGGGDPATVQALCSYLFDPAEPVHLNSLFYRPSNETTEFWTEPDTLESDAFPSTPVWVLTSGYTFSGGEEFAYNLKTRDRATLIGETTGGGAHPVNGFMLDGGTHRVMIPVGRAINPVTNDNWEGAGVTPHHEVPADDALELALSQALETLAGSDDPAKADRASWALTTLRAREGGIPLDSAAMDEAAGDYGDRQIMLRDGALWYERSNANAGGGSRKLICVAPDTFVIDGVPGFKLALRRDAGGKVQGVEGHYQGRGPDYNQRLN